MIRRHSEPSVAIMSTAPQESAPRELNRSESWPMLTTAGLQPMNTATAEARHSDNSNDNDNNETALEWRETYEPRTNETTTNEASTSSKEEDQHQQKQQLLESPDYVKFGKHTWVGTQDMATLDEFE